jgi:putative flavoprotein involved in K+ transport
MSRSLTERSIDHVVLERGTVANSWKKERWDGLRLLTPNWQSRLPGRDYDGDDPDGFMTMPEVIDFLERYAARLSAPIHDHTLVTSVRREEGGYRVATSQGEWECKSLVLATGACNVSVVPPFADALSSSVLSLTPMTYSSPAQLPHGGVLVVGASSTGLQLAYDIRRSGREVTIAVGEHLRLPRLYRGKDIEWWLDATGALDLPFDQVDNLARARGVPSPQLIGSPERRTLNLNELAALGVRIVGRCASVSGCHVQFSGSLRNMCKLADLKMNRLLKHLDEWAVATGQDDAVEPAHRFEPTSVASSPLLELNLESSEIQTVIWATGYRPDYSWLHVPVLDAKGLVRHHGGVVDSPGMYLMGMNFLRRRKSAFIHGAADDARDLSEHLVGYLDASAKPRQPATS